MKWHIVYTRPRWEKKVHRSLTEKGIESFCPVNRITRRWSDRNKLIEEPVFRSHIFVKICDNDRTNVRMTEGVVNFVYTDGKVLLLKEREVQTIKQFLIDYPQVEIAKVKTDLTTGNGSVTGDFLNSYKRKSKLHIGSLGVMLYVTEKNNLIGTSTHH